jgi:hypothetical protein
MKNNRILKKSLAAALAVTGLASFSAQAYGPLYIHDYASGTPYRWDVTEPVQVWTDGGNFASGTVWLRNPDLDTCNSDGGWVCNEEVYVEFTNEQGVNRVAEALASWSAVPTSSFQAVVAGTFAEIGIGGEDGDITGAPEEFIGEGENQVHEILGTDNVGDGIHVVFDEDGSVLANVFGIPYGVLGIASPEWADEETGIIKEGWAFIGGAGTYYNDDDLAQMAGVITHELGHSFNLAHTQTNGHIVMYGDWTPLTAGPLDCSAHFNWGGEYQLPWPQDGGPGAEHMSVMYPYIDNNPNSWPAPTGQYQATASTSEDFAALSSVYPAESFASGTGAITGSVTYPFSSDGIIGLNIVARNIDNPYEDAITVMTGDWNDGESNAAQGFGEFTMQGLTPGARYVVHVETIFAGGFPTPQTGMPGPDEYWNGARENDDATKDNACDFETIMVEAGETRTGIDIQVNGIKKAPVLVINPAPNGNNVTENGQIMAGTVENAYGNAISWVHHEGRNEYQNLPMGGITMSDNGSVIAGRVNVDDQYLPARLVPGKRIEIIPPPGNNACDQGGGIDEYYSNFAISPDGKSMGGFLWNCDDSQDYPNYKVSAVTYDDQNGWSILNDHTDGSSSRVNALANGGVAVGWAENDFGFWEGRAWKDGAEINMKEIAPEEMIDVGQLMALTSNGEFAVGISAGFIGLDDWGWEVWNERGYTYNLETGEFALLDIAEACPWWDWFCFGDKPFNPYDVSDDGTMVGAFGSASGSGATLHNELLGTQKLADFLRGQGVINAADLAIVSAANKISTNGKHIVGWTAVDGFWGSFKLTLDQLWVCLNGKSMQVGYPGGVETQLAKGAALGMCEDDLPLQYKANI